METKPLLYGLIGFFIGGLIVSVAATTFEKPEVTKENTSMTASMDASTSGLKNKTGDEFDKAFITEMIAHHEGAVEMAKVAQSNAKHDEIKQLADAIITAQEKEITEMKQWQMDWGYTSEKNTPSHNSH